MKVLVALLPLLTVAPVHAVTTFTFERTKIPMRDGVLLSADIWRPVVEHPVGVIITLTPYHVLDKALDRTETDLPTDIGEDRWVRAGYAYARVDVRGTYNSGGCWDYGGVNERHDGYDTVQWFGGELTDGAPSPAAAWSNGRVAMIGASYDGTTANAAAVEHPSHLATIVPISSISRWYGYAYQQGARATYSGEAVDADPPGDTPTDFMFAYGTIPPPDQTGLNDPAQFAPRFTPCERAEETLHGYSTQPDYDDFWRDRDYLMRAADVNVPVLISHGLLDFNVKTWEGTAWFQALSTPKIMVIGQWPHALPTYSKWNALLLKWWDRWLNGTPNGVEFEAPIRVQDNTNEFRDDASWGDGTVETRSLGTGARSYLDDGALTESEMLRGVNSDRYLRVAIPDTTAMHIQGRPVLNLSANSDQTSTHFIADLCDVGRDGVCNVVSRAFENARYDDSLEHGTDLVPGAQTSFALEFIDKDYALPAGHHFEVIIASSSATWVLSNELRATNTIFLGDSSLDLPQA